MPKTTYIVPVWINDQNTLDLTKAAIENFKTAPSEAELILIDNASSLGGGYLREEADIYIRNEANLGYTPAVNQGLKLATGEVITVCNNDILISSNWLAVAEPILRDPTVGVLHFRMVHYHKFGLILYGNGVAKEGKERWCTNSFFATTRIFLDKLRIAEKLETDEPNPGLFDENFGKGIYDDYDWHWRIDQAGFKQAYTDQAYYAHKMGYSFKKMPTEEYEAMIKKNLAYFKSKWGKDPEELFKERWSDQWQQEYRSGFKL